MATFKLSSLLLPSQARYSSHSLTNIQVNKGTNGDISQQAVMLLKLKVQNSWSTDKDKENVNQNQTNEYHLPLNFEDKEFIKQNIFKAIDNAPSKMIRQASINLIQTIRSAFEAILFNVAECDFPEQFQNAMPEIDGRLKSENDAYIVSGLRALL